VAAYYNEIEPFAAAWLRELMKAGHIMDGTVDERSIRDVQPADLSGFTRCHFFAGIGGWDHALDLAGWGDAPVWTGSCPCQPFSAAGKGAGFSDDRHLWPDFFRLIRECRPDVVFGEQVASGAGLTWLDLVSADLEGAGYAIGAADLCAAGLGASHRRQRLYFVAQPERVGSRGWRDGDPASTRTLQAAGRGGAGGLADAERERGRRGPAGREDAGDARLAGEAACTDGKARPAEPRTFPLAHGVPARVVRLRGYGNAIVPQVAAAFIEAYLDVRGAA
jgi:DNA (cytosine-5)-methyltransferase 1